MTEPATATAARTPITIPAMSPPLSLFDEDPVDPVVPLLPPLLEVDVDVGRTEGMATTVASTPSSNTACETLNVLEL